MSREKLQRLEERREKLELKRLEAVGLQQRRCNYLVRVREEKERSLEGLKAGRRARKEIEDERRRLERQTKIERVREMRRAQEYERNLQAQANDMELLQAR
eukprot:751608-Hanusia_phi.AAC.1